MNGAFTIVGGNSIGSSVETGTTISGWTYFEHAIKVTSTKITIQGTGSIDWVRLRPVSSKVNTDTYDPLAGTSSSADDNGGTTYFEYDDFHQLRAVKDKYENILNRHHRHYANTPQ